MSRKGQSSFVIRTDTTNTILSSNSEFSLSKGTPKNLFAGLDSVHVPGNKNSCDVTGVSDNKS